MFLFPKIKEIFRERKFHVSNYKKFFQGGLSHFFQLGSKSALGGCILYDYLHCVERQHFQTRLKRIAI